MNGWKRENFLPKLKFSRILMKATKEKMEIILSAQVSTLIVFCGKVELELSREV